MLVIDGSSKKGNLGMIKFDENKLQILSTNSLPDVP